jgi:CelD/BcsL family acetyltransferase involved in cellulose biosynthesis
MPLITTRHDARPTSTTGMQVVEAPRLGGRATEWDALAASGRLPSPFLMSWWLEAMEPGGGATFVLCLDSGRLVGGLALAVRNLGPLTRVRMLGDGPLAPDHLDLVAEDGREAEVVAALRNWLMARSQCLIDLRGLAEGALVLAALPSGSLVTQLSTAPYLQLPAAGPIVPKVRRASLRRQAKRLEALGANHRVVHGGEAGTERALRNMRRLHIERWGDRSGLARGFPALAAAVRSSHGAAQIEELLIDGEVVASDVSVDIADRRHLYQGGRSMDHRWGGAGNVLLMHVLHRAQADGLAEYDFLRGTESYKYMWATGERQVLRARAAVGTGPRCHLWCQRLAEHGRPAARQVKAWVRSRRAGTPPPSS